jgi:hypothetical protein
MAPIAVFYEAGVSEGVMPSTDGRLSESLNAGKSLRIQLSGGDADRARWIDFASDSIVAVAPPPLPKASALRVSRRRHLVELRAGLYRITGTVHLPTGSDPLRYIRTVGRQWLPLTNCTIEFGPDGWTVDTLIVNLDQVSRADAGRAI